VLQVITHLTDQCAATGTALTAQAQRRQDALAKIMRRFGRQCRGQGKVFVSLVRQTETQLLESGQPVVGLARAVQECVQGAAHLTEDQQGRLATQLTGALAAHHQIVTQSRRLTTGKTLTQCKIVTAYDPTIAPICKGKSNCPTQFGRKPGIIAEPASGFTFAFHLPAGNPTDPSSVVPLVDKVQHAIGQVSGHPTLAIHSLAGDLALNDASLRATLHGRGILTVGIPQTVEPLPPVPTQKEVLRILHEAGLTHKRTPHQVQLACAGGYSRPVVESIIASLLGRGAARITYKGQRGAIVQMGMAVMAHNAATLRRIHQDRLSKRAQKFRRLLRLKRHNVTEFNAPKN
jgi:hypothetical protein